MKKLSLTLLVLLMGVTYAQAQRPQKQRTSLKQQIQNKQKLNYDDFVQEANKKYEEFRDSVNRKYAAFMEKAWKDYPIEDAVDRPKEDDVKPIEYDKEKDENYLEQQKQQEAEKKLAEEKKKCEEEQARLAVEQRKQQEELQRLQVLKKQQEEQQKLLEQQQKKEELAKLLAQKKQQEELERIALEKQKEQQRQQKLLQEKQRQQEEQQRQLAEQKRQQQERMSKPIEAVVVPVVLDVKPQPKPQNPIAENKESMATSDFEFYGTPMKVRWGNAKQFKLKGTSKKDFSDGFLELTSKGYTNLVHDCLELRKEYKLCDWAYYKMLQTIAEKACGKGTNEAVFLQGVLLNQSGYQIRFALEDNAKLHIMSRMDGFPYDRGYLTADGKPFFLMDGSKAKNLMVCDAAYPGEQMMSLSIAEQPEFKKNLSDNRTVISRFVNVQADMQMNKNLMDFYTDYPTSYDGKDMMTRWAYYANTPVSQEVKDKVYPQLKQQIGNAPKLMAANMLLNWVQMGLTYAYDDKVWGHDRAFFAEESLFYPFCDCEDRSILFSHLMRDLLDLDVVLVYCPGHLYTAVCFNEDVTGDYIMVNGRKFTVADPTYYNANVGKTMSKMDNSKAKVILLKR